ncbi:NUDIX domain-containing protein [Spirillospora sp. CA-253888]
MPPTWPVSVKGVAAVDGRVILLRNERGEWELPGGRLEAGDPGLEDTLAREIAEGTGWAVLTPDRVPVVSHEHEQLALVPVEQVPGLHMPEGYKHSIAAWLRLRP